MWKVLEELSVLGAMEGKVMAPWTVKGMEKSHTASFSVPFNSAFSLCPKDPNPAGFVKKKKKNEKCRLVAARCVICRAPGGGRCSTKIQINMDILKKINKIK